MSNNHRNEDQTSTPSPDQGFGKSLTPQLSSRPFGRVLFLTFLPCFLWPPLVVTSVQAQSPAGQADLKVGDAILQVNGKPPKSFIEFTDLLAASNLVPPVVWATVATNTADSNRAFTFTELGSTDYLQRFYEILMP